MVQHYSLFIVQLNVNIHIDGRSTILSIYGKKQWKGFKISFFVRKRRRTKNLFALLTLFFEVPGKYREAPGVQLESTKKLLGNYMESIGILPEKYWNFNFFNWKEQGYYLKVLEKYWAIT